MTNYLSTAVSLILVSFVTAVSIIIIKLAREISFFTFS